MAQLNRSDCPVLRDQVSMPVAASWELRPMPRGARKLALQRRPRMERYVHHYCAKLSPKGEGYWSAGL